MVDVRPPGADYNLKIAQPMLRWIADTRGTKLADEISRNAGVPGGPPDKPVWISLESFETILRQVREVTPDEATFRLACAYRMIESYGALKFMFWALSPSLVYAQALKNFGPICSITTGEVVARGPEFVKVRIRSQRPESRLVCLSRQAQAVVLPTVWGLPHATLKEGKCLGFGDDCCEYEIRWYAARSWMPPILGAMGGISAGWVLRSLGVGGAPMEPALGLIAAILGAYWDLRKTNDRNIGHARGIHQALEETVREDTQLRAELLAFHHREAEWSRVLEEQVSERTRSLRVVVEQIRELREQRVVKIRDYSHDLRNPLTTIRLSLAMARRRADPGSDLAEGLLEADQAVDRVTDLLDHMLKAAHAEASSMTLVPQQIDVHAFADSLRRRVRALVLGRNIRVTVIETRESPKSIETDAILLDRVVDNLLTNAAKYTEAGSIVIQLDGRPGFLVLQVSDTGCGMDPDRIKEVFKGRGSDRPSPGSFGVGLSVVVNLLAQVHGELEVMSLPGKGTTFWALLPVTLPPIVEKETSAESSDEQLHRVVKIRQQAGK